MTETAVQERVSLRECQWCCAPPGSTRDALPAVGLTEGKRESPVALMLRKWLSQRNPCLPAPDLRERSPETHDK